MTDRRFEGKVAIVTGGTAGIGLGTVERLAAEGAQVVAAARGGALPDDVATRLGDAVVAVACDVSVEADVERTVQTAVDCFGGLDVVVANAGIGGMGRIVNMELADWQRITDVCLDGTFLTIKHAGRVMNDGGAIVVTTSLNAVQPALGMAPYCAAKAGLAMLVQVAAMELGERGIRVNAVAPGLVHTPANDLLFQVPDILASFCYNTTLGRSGDADEIAALIAFLASDEASFVTGTQYLADGGAATKRYPVLPFV
jgi:NAD(P)-dependent dehydrogenase (short-subunit alcohol dehydrogenase family)